MTREEAMNYLERIKQEYDCSYEEDALDMAIKALEQTQWIPVSERYPQTQYKHFFVTDDKGKVSIQEFYLSLDEERRPYFSGMVNVIAWMPLPEPYREVEK
jgi:hypothetical protein